MSRLVLVCVCLAVLPGCGYEIRSKSVPESPAALSARREQEQKERLERAEREQRVADLGNADALVARTAERLRAGAPAGGNEPDPWGTMVAVDSAQEWHEEVFTVRSAGPNRLFEPPGVPSDDLSRTVRRVNPWGLHRGLGALPWVLLVLGVCGTLALYGTHAKGRPKKKKHPLLSAVAIVLASPVILIAFLGMILVGTLGSVLGDGDGFDFDGGFDLFDFDIDIF